MPSPPSSTESRRAARDRLCAWWQSRASVAVRAGITSLKERSRSSGWRCPTGQPISTDARGLKKRRLTLLCWRPRASLGLDSGRLRISARRRDRHAGFVEHRHAGSSPLARSASPLSPSARARLQGSARVWDAWAPYPASGFDPQPRPLRQRASLFAEAFPSRPEMALQAGVAAPKAAGVPSPPPPLMPASSGSPSAIQKATPRAEP